MENVATPEARLPGTTKLICEGETYSSEATADAPFASVTVTVTPPSEVTGWLGAVVVTGARCATDCEPKIEAIDPCATAPLGAAAECTSTGGITP